VLAFAYAADRCLDLGCQGLVLRPQIEQRHLHGRFGPH
jgi:hypothetical protein